ncbi:M48 family metalloprotease [Nonomuraea rubra]|uniref:M48 family metalloprotease n=1 Tax=Nonomuraea rubra TaxID=46180 RepID=UPI0031EADB7A
MRQGPLRTNLLDMAARDGVPVEDVLVADASRRTTALNAYVSGFGATRRIVVYDTLLRAPQREVELVVAHELGHAKYDDVLYGTVHRRPERRLRRDRAVPGTQAATAAHRRHLDQRPPGGGRGHGPHDDRLADHGARPRT